MTSSLISLACDQVNSAGPGLVADDGLRRRLARWNRRSSQSSFCTRAAEVSLSLSLSRARFLPWTK